MKQPYYAHTTDDGRKQRVICHLEEVSALAKEFGEKFSMGNQCSIVGLFHDIGKYSNDFQKRLLYQGEKVDHSSAGAIEAKKLYPSLWDMVFAYVISGHHSGLLDYGSCEHGLLKRLGKKDLLANYDDYRDEVEIIQIENEKDFVNRIKNQNNKNIGFKLSFLIRMIYSSLVDADFLNTEAFMNISQSELRNNYESKTILYERFHQYIVKLQSQTSDLEINKERNAILKQCILKGKDKPGFYTLTVPTGGGKTISSMAFALEHQKKYNKDKIIYAIPYTSIIQQVSAVFKEIFHENNVLEHHSNYDFYEEGKKDYEQSLSMHLSSENWDKPITVTTNVQFFESLFANKPSRCRKLHNLANSIIILDEAQMIPLYYLTPCLTALEELVENYGATIVFCTATKPQFPAGILSLATSEIIEDAQSIYNKFQRVEIKNIGEKSDEEIISLLSAQNSCLCIVNKRKHAKHLFEQLESPNKFHLSGDMCHKHREKVLNDVKSRLKANEPCILISTQLIECGVDISFPVVFRAMAGLDSIIQAAGRCNRENELAKINKQGTVIVFQPTDPDSHLQGFQQLTASCGMRVMKKIENFNNLLEVNKYFKKLYSMEKDSLDKNHIMKHFNQSPQDMAFNFNSAAEDFHLIEDTKSIIVPYDKNAEKLMNEFEFSKSKKVLKKLQQYTISTYPQQINLLTERGGIKQIGANVYFLTTKDGFYDNEMGLMWKMEDLIM